MSQAQPTVIHTRAPAKLNLFLEVLGRRPDGYHDLVSVMHAIDLVDDVTVRRVPHDQAGSPPVTLRCAPPVTQRPEENLAHRAARALLTDDARIGVEIDLKKRIPSEAGLGGGSSDAASVLLAVDRLTGCARGRAELTRIAATLGADVPFFLTGGTALCEGIGDRVTAIPNVPPLTFVVVVPGVKVSTGAVFRDPRLNLTAPRRDVTVFARCLSKGDVDLISGAGSTDGPFNRLAAVAFERHPALRTIERALRDRGGREFQLTGSGAGLFAFCPGGETEAERLRARLTDIRGIRAIHMVRSHAAGSTA